MVQKKIYQSIKRIFDVSAAAAALIILALPLGCIALAIKLTSSGPVIHWSRRIGKNNLLFQMAKFRTMRVDTPQVATHLLKDSSAYVTSIGKFLRKFSLDELPQLINIISGDLSFVGPRPALFNQDDLIRLRTEKNVHKFIPGLTGWAQINGRDELQIPQKVEFDAYYCEHSSFLFDIKIIVLTVFKAFSGAGVCH